MEKLFEKSSKNKQFFTDKFSIADITAWRVIYWFWSGTLDQIKPDFLEKFPFLQKFFQKMSKYEDFHQIKRISRYYILGFCIDILKFFFIQNNIIMDGNPKKVEIRKKLVQPTDSTMNPEGEDKTVLAKPIIEDNKAY